MNRLRIIAIEIIAVIVGSVLAGLGIYFVRNTSTVITGGGTGFAMIIQDIIYDVGLERLYSSETSLLVNLAQLLERIGQDTNFAVTVINGILFIIGIIYWFFFRDKLVETGKRFLWFAAKTGGSMWVIYQSLDIFECIFNGKLPPDNLLFLSFSFLIMFAGSIFALVLRWHNSIKNNERLENKDEKIHVNWKESFLHKFRMFDIFALLILPFLSIPLRLNLNYIPIISLSGLLIGVGMALICIIGGNASSGGTDTLSNIIGRCGEAENAQIFMRILDFIILGVGAIAAFLFDVNLRERLVFAFILVTLYGISFEVMKKALDNKSITELKCMIRKRWSSQKKNEYEGT